MIEFRNTKHQTARGSRPDSENHSTLFLFKKVSALGLTYQIRMLTYMAANSQRRLQIRVPRECVLSRLLQAYIREHRKYVYVERV